MQTRVRNGTCCLYNELSNFIMPRAPRPWSGRGRGAPGPAAHAAGEGRAGAARPRPLLHEVERRPQLRPVGGQGRLQGPGRWRMRRWMVRMRRTYKKKKTVPWRSWKNWPNSQKARLAQSWETWMTAAQRFKVSHLFGEEAADGVGEDVPELLALPLLPVHRPAHHSLRLQSGHGRQVQPYRTILYYTVPYRTTGTVPYRTMPYKGMVSIPYQTESHHHVLSCLWGGGGCGGAMVML